jgi:hypothetical protein
MSGRDISVARQTADRARLGRRALLWTTSFAVVLAIGIVIGTRLTSPGERSLQTVTERAAPPTRAAQAPGRHATSTFTGARTEAGAVAAAARSITAFAGTVLLEPSRLRAVVARIASSQSRAQLVEAFERASAQTRAKLGADTVPRPVIVLRAAPVGYRIKHYSSAEATIEVWYVGIVGSGATVQPQQSWRTQTVNLVWEHGGWKVNSFASSAGPTPALATTEAEAPGALFEAITRFHEFGYGAR